MSRSARRGIRRVLLLLPLVLAAVPMAVVPALALEFTSSNLPIILIDTPAGDIPDEPKVDARMRVIDNGPGRRNRVDDEPSAYDGIVGIELRGSSSLNFPKKSFGLETREEDGSNRNFPLLGLPEENDWVLHGPYSDKSLMRNVIAYWIANELGRYASRARFCELVIDGHYMGLYVLLEKVKRDGERIDIARLREDEVGGEDVTGGYILRIDRFAAGVDGGWFSWLQVDELRPFYRYEYPDAGVIRPAQEHYIQNFVNDLETALLSPEFTDPEVGYRRYLDLDSLVDYVIVNEIAKNVDAYRLSMFMFKDRDRDGGAGKLEFGPVWDFNLGFGNVDYDVHPDAPIRGAQTAGLLLNSRILWSSWQFWFWLRRIFQDPEFIARLDRRWRQVRTDLLTEERIESRIEAAAELLAEVQERNFARWPVLGVDVWPNYFVGRSHREEVDYLKDWFRQRLLWMDAELMAAAATVPDIDLERVTIVAAAEPRRPDRFALLPAFPNPFNGAATISYQLPEAGQVRLAVHSILGQEVAILAQGWRGSGVHRLTWNGRDAAGRSVGSGPYLLELRAPSGAVAGGRLTVVR